MCVAYPGTVLTVKEHSAIVDFRGTKVEAATGLVSAKPGDRVLVHAGCVLQVLPPEEADEMDEIFRELAEAEEETRRAADARAALRAGGTQ